MVKCFTGARPFCGCFSPSAAVDGVRSIPVAKSEPRSVSVPSPAPEQEVIYHPAADAHKSGRLAITFSGGGFLLPYFIGVADTLLQLGVLRIGGTTTSTATATPAEVATKATPPADPDRNLHPNQPHSLMSNPNPNPASSSTVSYIPTPLAGSSAGSLMAVSLACGLTPARILDSFLDSVHDCRTNGSYRRLEEVLYRQLESSLPPDAAEQCGGVATVSVTQLFPRPRTRCISTFASREELIRALMASCHIPTYFNGELTTSFRSKVTVDGGVTALLPAPTAPHDFLLKVCCFPRHQVARLPVFNRRRALHQLALGITPDAFAPWPYTFRYMLAAALHPRSYRFIRVLLEAGHRDASRWAEAAGIADSEQLRNLKPLPLPNVLLQPSEQQPPDVGPGPGAGADANWVSELGASSEQFHAIAAATFAAEVAEVAGEAGQKRETEDHLREGCSFNRCHHPS